MISPQPTTTGMLICVFVCALCCMRQCRFLNIHFFRPIDANKHKNKQSEQKSLHWFTQRNTAKKAGRQLTEKLKKDTQSCMVNFKIRPTVGLLVNLSFPCIVHVYVSLPEPGVNFTSSGGLLFNVIDTHACKQNMYEVSSSPQHKAYFPNKLLILNTISHSAHHLSTCIL